MEQKLGSRIARLRKAKGLTQEQLGAALGISAPAVSKWETNASCPDIALLCPLARALGTNVDTLLQFEETLSEEQCTAYMNEILETARTGHQAQAEERLWKLLRTYPSSPALKYQAAMVLTVFELWFPTEDEAKKETRKARRIQLFQQIYDGGDSGYKQRAAAELAACAIAEGKLEKAEQFLKELPKEHADQTFLKTSYYLKREEPQKAKEVLQNRLYYLASQTQMCLIQLTREELEPDPEQALEICKISEKLEEMFGTGSQSSGMAAILYERAGKKEQALESLLAMAERACGTVQMPNPVLFSEMLLKGMLTDDTFAGFREETRFQEAVQKLRDSIGEKA
ncbi:MAG: helix-turn-helix transcriptional regulator [Eubacteriales bacterium]|nr:helix-turn-helix transcriptional regulator [Eubacteriales bacterium]